MFVDILAQLQKMVGVRHYHPDDQSERLSLWKDPAKTITQKQN